MLYTYPLPVVINLNIEILLPNAYPGHHFPDVYMLITMFPLRDEDITPNVPMEKETGEQIPEKWLNFMSLMLKSRVLLVKQLWTVKEKEEKGQVPLNAYNTLFLVQRRISTNSLSLLITNLKPL